MSKSFDNFLERHRADIITTFKDTVTKTTPVLNPEEAPAFTKRVVDLYLGLILGKDWLTDPAMQAAIAEARQRQITPELGRERGAIFFSMLKKFCTDDKSLTPAEQEHIIRIIEQSERFFPTMTSALKQSSKS